MDSEFLLLLILVLRNTRELLDSHGSLDLRLVDVEYSGLRDNEDPVLAPLVLVNLLDFVTEQDVLYTNHKKLGSRQ